jgi:hypothetical protein
MKKIILLLVLAGFLLNPVFSQDWVKNETNGIDQTVSVSETFIPPKASPSNLDGVPSGGLLLIPESGNDKIMAFDPTTGDLVDENFIVDDVNDFFSTPIQILQKQDRSGFYVSDQVKDVVVEIDNDGNYVGIFAPAGGANTAICDNIRGMEFKNGTDHLLVSDGNHDAILEFDGSGNYLGTFGAAGRMDPFDILYWPTFNQYLVSDIDGPSGTNDTVMRVDNIGNVISKFVSGINYPEQIAIAANGNILVAMFSLPSGIYEYLPDGTQEGYYDVITGCRGVYELPNGNLLVTAGTGVHEISRSNTLVNTKYNATGYSFRYINFVEATAVNVTFRIDMQGQTVPPEGVHIAGSFPDPYPFWLPNGIMMDAPALGSVYTKTLSLVPGTYIEFKYINGDDWGEDESVPPCCAQGLNRFFTVPDEDVTLPLVCYGECYPCNFGGTPRDITFRVDLSDATYSTGAYIAGSFQDPQWTPQPMTNMGNDIFEITLTLEESACHEYKFVIDGTSWENFSGECLASNGNRFLEVPDYNQILDLVCFGSCNPCSGVNVKLQVDMSEQTVSELVYVAGSFNGWNSTANPLTDLGSGIWETTLVLQTGQEIEYKFINGTTTQIWEDIPGACAWNGNRHLVVPEANTTLDLVCFGSCNACTPASTVDVTFQVDMSTQIVSGGVFIAGDFNDWSATATPMTDAGNNIYQATINLGVDFIYGYKFINGDVWEDVPGDCNYNGNRRVIVPETNTTLPPDCFGGCGECEISIYSFDLTVMLEGPFNGTDMNTTLYDNGALPVEQPFNEAPWNYPGTEMITALLEADIVEWVLLEFRETDGDASTATPDKLLDRQAAVVLADGSIVRPDGVSTVLYTGNITQNLYVIVHQRNHLSIMSSAALVETAGDFVYDFTDALSKAYSDGQDGQKSLGGGMYGMIGGDSDANGIVEMNDKDTKWSLEAGVKGYFDSDLNLDTQVNNPDKVELWEPNLNSESQIPQ